MRILQVGSGSMGRRRLRDLSALGNKELLLFEPQEQRCQEISKLFNIKGFTNFEDALSQDPQVMVISTPPALHERYVAEAVKRKMHVFAEVPFIYNLEQLENLADEIKGYPSVLGISHTLRFHPPVRILRDLIQGGAIGRPLYMEHSLGNYLPDWHPYEDYRQFYANDVKLGGAGMDMVLWELSSILWWMGPIASVRARFSKVSSLEIKGPDCQDALLSFVSGAAGYFHHDIIEQGTQGRHFRLAGEDGSLEWHQSLKDVRLYDGKTKQARMIPFSEAKDWPEAVRASEQMRSIQAALAVNTGQVAGSAASGDAYVRESDYLREMEHFLGAVRGEHPYTLKTFAEELSTVRTFHALFKSAETGEPVNIDSDPA